MIIDDLPSISIANDSDEIAIEQGTATKKITKGNFLQEIVSSISSLISDISGKVSKAGDTMSGNLFINSPINTNCGIYEQSDYLDSTSAPSNDTYTVGLRFRDKNNVQTGMFNNGYLTTGNVVTQMHVQRPVNGSNVQNLLRLGVMPDGTRAVTLSDPAAWRSALETIKYANIAASDTTASANDYATAINLIIASVAPQNWTKGAYAGTFQKTNSGTQSAWTGQYILNVYNPSGNWATQGIVAVQGRIYNVWYRNGAWATSEMLRYDDYFYAVNEIFATSMGETLPGVTNGNSTIIYFTLPVDKSMEKISTVTVTSFNGWIAGPNGAFNNSTSSTQFVGASGYSIACTKTSNHSVRIALTKSSAFSNAVNNSVAIFFGTATLKFT